MASTAVVLIVILDPPLKLVAVPVTFPLIAIVLAVWRAVAVDAFHVRFPMNHAVEFTDPVM